ncbi:hypothetical protein I7I53_02611 [Histoplasma capsulatum var. duboisii H88]|uniref:Uncharacterized protein n=1 Tax=Ajellomyces capsulatus (strain H88) TaxID=544711 RepID=A0A8A1LP81_AJEC8|nr:hypothetical protein I7I53_02611 [Histoplasma capsulatum var. duboisii H88]
MDLYTPSRSILELRHPE